MDLGSWAWVDQYEMNDHRGDARSLISGQLIEAYLETDSDRDFFTLPDLLEEDTLTVDVTSLPVDYDVSLIEAVPFGTCGQTEGILRPWTTVDDESMSFTLTATEQPRFVRIDSSLGSFDAADSYLMSAVITRPETTAFHGSLAFPHGLPSPFEKFVVAGTTTAVGERDFYKFDLPVGVTLTATVDNTVHDVEILDSTGVLLSSGLGSATWYTTGNYNTYHVVVEETATPSSGQYNLELTVD